VLAQLSNRVQHGLRAYTPAERKAVKAAAESFRENPAFNTADALEDLGTGEALVSFLDDEGRPSVVQRARVLFPACRMAAADQQVIDDVLAAQTTLDEKYGVAVDRESAYEMINDARQVEAANAQLAAEREAFEKEREAFEKERAKEAERAARELEREQQRQLRQLEREAEAARKKQEQEEARRAREAAKAEEARRRQQQKMVTDVAGSLLSPLFGKRTGKKIARGIFGTRL
jgi:septal ring factor EnvC (AmiA/AmiB activator)